MTALILVLLSLLQYGWGYSITSGPTIRYNPLNLSTGSTRRVSSTVGATTVSPVGLSKVLIPESVSSEDYTRVNSHYIRVRESSEDPKGRYSAPKYEHNQYTPTQLQMASRILFESRVSTPKPYLGYRSFISSYRNPNYFVKSSKNTEPLYGPSSKHPYPDEDEEARPIEEHVSKNESSSKTLYDNSSVQPTTEEWARKIPAIQSFTVDATTPESKTAPATDISLNLPTQRPSSNQQMRSDGTLLTGSESNNHYQFAHNNQWIRGYLGQENNRPVQVSSQDPSLSHSPPKTLRPYRSDEEKYFDYDSTISSHSLESSRELEGEHIAFPTTKPSPKPFYKLPGHPGSETNLSSVRNIVELRHGGDVNINADDSKANSSKEKLSPVSEGNFEPSCANNLGYCDNTNFRESYPKNIINSVLSNSISSDLFKKIFSDVDGTGQADAAADVVLAGRNNANPLTQETPLCHSQEVTIYPRAAKNKEDKWMFIVNHDDYIQGVKVEKCTAEGSSCLFGGSNPLGYESVCRQKFILRKLVALNDEGKTSLDTFKLPSCCVCFLKSSYIEDRTGVMSSVSRDPILSDKASNSSGQSYNAEVVAGVSNVPTECPEKTKLVETASTRNSSTLLPNLSQVILNSTKVSNI